MFNVEGLGRIILTIGGFMVLIGLVITLLGRFTGIGRLPGDIFIQRENFTFYFPLATTIIVSIILSLLLNLFRRF